MILKIWITTTLMNKLEIHINFCLLRIFHNLSSYSNQIAFKLSGLAPWGPNSGLRTLLQGPMPVTLWGHRRKKWGKGSFWRLIKLIEHHLFFIFQSEKKFRQGNRPETGVLLRRHIFTFQHVSKRFKRKGTWKPEVSF